MAVLLGLVAITPGVDVPEIPYWESAPADYRKRPVRKYDPIGALLAMDPLADPSEFFSTWKDRGFEAAVKGSDWVRPVYRALAAHMLQKSMSIVHNQRHELEILFAENPREQPPIRYALGDAFLDQRRVLTAGHAFGKTLDDLLESARDDVEATFRKRHAGSAFARRPEAISVAEHGQRTALQKIGLYGQRHGRSFRTLVRHQHGRAREARLMDPERALESRVERLCGKAEKFWKARVRAHMAATYPTGQPTRNMASKAELLQLIYATSSVQSDEDVVVAFCLAAMVRPKLLRRTYVDSIDEHWCLVRFKIRYLHGMPKDRERLFLRAGKYAYRVVPRRIGDAFVELKLRRPADKTLGRRHHLFAAINEADNRCREILPSRTLSTCLDTLLIHGNAYFGVDYAVGYYGLTRYPLCDALAKSKVPAPLHYTHCGGESVVRAQQFLWQFTDSRAPIRLGRVGNWGARYCPDPEATMKPFIASFVAELTSRHVPDSIEDGIRDWNAVAACLHLMAVLLAGLRNYRGTPAIPRNLDRGYVELVQEKGFPVPVYVPAVLRNLLNLGRERWTQFKEHWVAQGVNRMELPSEDFHYGIIDEPRYARDGTWRFTALCHLRAMVALFNVDRFRRYSFLHQNSMRDLSNTLLRQSGLFKESEVRAFHHHSERLLAALRRHHIEPVVCPKRLEAMADYVADQIGLIVK